MNSSAYFIFGFLFLLLWTLGEVLYQQYNDHFVDLARLKFHVYGVLSVLLALGWLAEAKAGERASLVAEECIVDMTRRVDELEGRIELATRGRRRE